MKIVVALIFAVAIAFAGYWIGQSGRYVVVNETYEDRWETLDSFTGEVCVLKHFPGGEWVKECSSGAMEIVHVK